ncbi:hypothetical protein L596_029837 [Steinernema carpocapsae]|uniref:Sema domain-containing protein n=1 Tax=Steinernema carpocapsae TaxID=34508 RepID=A0A4V5ZX43_STECR|nr:hypothetical protein L596_029837 [Steinernema carpocapsae]
MKPNLRGLMAILLWGTLALAAPAPSSSRGRTTMEALLHTNQFLIIGFAGCNITIETNVPTRSCPLYLTTNVTDIDHCSWESVALLSNPSPDSPTPPRILVVGKKNHRTAAYIKELEFPKEVVNGHNFVSSSIFEKSREVSNELHFPSKVKSALYDSDRRTLYLFAGEGKNLKLYEYVYHEDEAIDKTLLTAGLSPSLAYKNLRSTKLYSDPYTKKYYYTVTEQEKGVAEPVIAIKSFPYADFNRFLANDLKENQERSMNFNRDKISVSGGAIFAMIPGKSESHIVLPISNDDKVGIRCNFTRRTHYYQNRNEAVLVVRDWDYCKVRSGEKANFKACQEANTWLNKKPEREPEGEASGASGAPGAPGASEVAEASSTVFHVLLFGGIALVIVLITAVLVFLCVRHSRYDAEQNVKNVQAAYPHIGSELSYDF